MLRGIVTQDVTHAGSGLAHQTRTEVDRVSKDCVLCSDAGSHTRAKQLASGDSNASLPAQRLHAVHYGQCSLQGKRSSLKCARDAAFAGLVCPM